MSSKIYVVEEPEVIQQLLTQFRVLHLAFSQSNFPYVVPFDFGFSYEKDVLLFYLHVRKRGRVFHLLRSLGTAGFELDGPFRIVGKEENPLYFQSYYASIIGGGTLHELTDIDEKRQALNKIIQHTTGNQAFLLQNLQIEESDLFVLKATEFSCRLRKR
ncbi:MAG: pyridoxamine 5'-phosphate oxidase family protein [Enterococcus sp.]